jgi:hypothetical protein
MDSAIMPREWVEAYPPHHQQQHQSSSSSSGINSAPVQGHGHDRSGRGIVELGAAVREMRVLGRAPMLSAAGCVVQQLPVRPARGRGGV